MGIKFSRIEEWTPSERMLFVGALKEVQAISPTAETHPHLTQALALVLGSLTPSTALNLPSKSADSPASGKRLGEADSLGDEGNDLEA